MNRTEMRGQEGMQMGVLRMEWVIFSKGEAKARRMNRAAAWWPGDAWSGIALQIYIHTYTYWYFDS